MGDRRNARPKVHLRDDKRSTWTACGWFRGVYSFAERPEDVTCGHCVKLLARAAVGSGLRAEVARSEPDATEPNISAETPPKENDE